MEENIRKKVGDDEYDFHQSPWPLGLLAISRCRGRGPSLAKGRETFCVSIPQQSSGYPGHLETAGALVDRIRPRDFSQIFNVKTRRN